MNLKTLLVMSIVSLSGILLGGDSRGDDFSGRLNINYMSENDDPNQAQKNGYEKHQTETEKMLTYLKVALRKFTPQTIAQVRGANISAGVLAMSSQNDNEAIAGAPRFKPQLTVSSKSDWYFMVSMKPDVTMRGVDMSRIYAQFHMAW